MQTIVPAFTLLYVTVLGIRLGVADTTVERVLASLFLAGAVTIVSVCLIIILYELNRQFLISYKIQAQKILRGRRGGSP